MISIESKDCESCGIKVFLFNDGNHIESKYEDLIGSKPHTKLDCKINAIITSRLKEVIKN